jgi:hypothetical protein
MNDLMFCHLQNESITDGQEQPKTAHSVSNHLHISENLHDIATLITQKLVKKLSSSLKLLEGVLISIAHCISMVLTFHLQLSLGILAMKKCGAEITVFKLMDNSLFK